MRKSFYRNIPSIIIFLLGISGAVWFLLPFILHGILNIGNATGLAVCSAAVIYSLFTKKIHLFLKKDFV